MRLFRGATEVCAVEEAEVKRYINETTSSKTEVYNGYSLPLEAPESLEWAQKSAEYYHKQSIEQILDENGKYMSESDRNRVIQGADYIRAVEHNPDRGYTGCYSFFDGKSRMEVSAIDQQQIERSIKHETNHFASKNVEMIVPKPDRNGYYIYQAVGTRQMSWFHSNETGNNSEMISKGQGLNEGLTTMYTNKQLMELSREKGESAERQGIYSHATELCGQLEMILGEDILKEAYYGGNLQKLKETVDFLAGENGFEKLRECLDRTISSNYVERVMAMRDAQEILAKMYERGEKKAC